MELLLEFNESRRPLRLAVDGNGAFKTIEDELKKCKKEISLSVCSSDDRPTASEVYILQKWSNRWSCFVDVIAEEDLADGDRITAIQKRSTSEVQVYRPTKHLCGVRIIIVYNPANRSLEPRHQPFAVVRKSPTRQMLEFLAAYLRRPPVLRGRGQIPLILLKSVLQRRNKRRRRELLDSSPAKLQCC